MYPIGALILLTLAVVQAPDDRLKNAREALVRQTLVYAEQLKALKELEESVQTRLEGDLRKRESLFGQGLVSRREVAESEERLRESIRHAAALGEQIRDSEDLVAEVRLALEEKPEPASVVTRAAANSPWSLEAVPRIQTFFQGRFGRALPISAWGQTALHDRFGLQHKAAIDVALHPDSMEGKELLEYLQEAGDPFIAFRAAVPGSATGAHIHIGPPSQRIHTFYVRGD